jgi:hypothetical protein
MPKPSRDWFFSIGPLNESEVSATRRALEAAVGDEREVTAFLYQEWYVGAWDASAVKAVIAVLEAGLEDSRTSSENRLVASGVLSILQMWLNKDYDQVSPEA